MIGIPTYGYEYEVAWVNGKLIYKRLRSHTFMQATQRARDVGATSTRNNAGELSFAYGTSTAVSGVSPNLTWSVSSTMPAFMANLTGANTVTRYVSFTDAESALRTITLAKKYGLRGAAFFKFDGDQDPNLWSVMK
jgi:spore germination protein YaaH